MLSMAYNNYRGRTGGRLMFYLYSMDRNADYWAGIGETEIEDCESEDEAMNIVLHNDILGCGILEFEIEEIDEISGLYEQREVMT